MSVGSRWTSVAALLWLVLPQALMAQDPLGPGDRVRVREAGGVEVVGTVEDIDADRIRISGSDGVHSSPVFLIESLERSGGRKRRFGHYFPLVAGGTVALGGLVAAMAWSPCDTCFIYPKSRSEAFGVGAVLGAVVGVPIGLLVGLSVKHDVWQPIPLPGASAVALDLTPVLGPGRVGLTASIHLGGG